METIVKLEMKELNILQKVDGQNLKYYVLVIDLLYR